MTSGASSAPAAASEIERAGSWMKVFAMAAVIATHVLQAYAGSSVVPAFVPDERQIVAIARGWPSEGTPEQAGAVQLAIYVLHVFPMPVFFYLAGRYAGRSASNRGSGDFLRRRVARLLPPLVIGALTVVPVSFALMSFGNARLRDAPFDDATAEAYQLFASGHYFDHGPPLAHLWFLWYLMIVTVAVWAVSHGAARVAWIRRLGARLRATRPSSRTLAMFVVSVACVALTPRSEIEEPDGFVLNVPLLLLCAAWYALGRLERDERLDGADRGGLWPCLVAVIVIPLACVLVRGAWTPTIAPEVARLLQVGLSGLSIVVAFAAIRGAACLMPASLDRIAGPLAAGALTIYVVHLPLVLAAQIAFIGTSVSAWGRVPVVFAMGLGGAWLLATLLGRVTDRSVAGSSPIRRPS